MLLAIPVELDKVYKINSKTGDFELSDNATDKQKEIYLKFMKEIEGVNKYRKSVNP